jgi:hypothetical protein
MTKEERETERRRQQAFERLGTTRPVCATCGESDPHCLEEHHIAGRRCDGAVALICRNCHRKLSDAHKDHPKSSQDPPSLLERAGRFLLGLADMLVLVVEKLREFGSMLIAEARQSATATDGRCHE